MEELSRFSYTFHLLENEKISSLSCTEGITLLEPIAVHSDILISYSLLTSTEHYDVDMCPMPRHVTNSTFGKCSA